MRHETSPALPWPARYGGTGVHSLLLNHDGVLHERDLGPETGRLARAMRRCDPGPGWRRLDPSATIEAPKQP